jgi:hypothetical protein
MPFLLDPLLVKDLTEAKAALARHGIVIIRSVETELEPAIVTEARDSMASSPGKLSKMKDKELDELVVELRKGAIKSANEISKLYTRLLTVLGTDQLSDLVNELDGMNQLFKWDRVAKAVDPVNKLLAGKGFRSISMSGPEIMSENFAVELGQKWPLAFERFKGLAEKALKVLQEMESQEARESPAPKRAKKARG